MATSTQFVNDWFSNQQWWFGATTDIDKHITITYGHLLDVQTFDDPYHGVLICDQLPHHVYRNTQSNHIIQYFLQLALSHLQKVHNINDLSNDQWCFAMLPYRHQNNTEKIHELLKQAWQRLYDDENSNILKRFIKATYERCPMNNQIQFVKTFYASNAQYNKFRIEDHKHVLQFAPDRTPLYTFDHGHPIVQAFEQALYPRTHDTIIVSLSGGVDSMVCLHVLHNLTKLMTNLNITLEVVHINYANRPTSDDEAFFVQNWTNCLGHNVRIRRIGEITREACMQHDMRNIYETYTRNVRYATYRSITPAAHVVLGHNKDDCLENIFTNILHQNKFDNLKGMSMYSVQDDISFLRPMLGISKKDIIQYARENSIPFLPNSTPSWSQRGQIRNTIVPCLDNWDSCFVPSMFTLSDVIAELYAMVTKQVNAFIKALVFENGCYQTKMCIETIPNSKVFWKCCFVALHIKVSARSLDNFMLKLQKYIDNPYAKELHVVMNKDTYLTMSSAKGEPIDISIATMIQYACSA